MKLSSKRLLLILSLKALLVFCGNGIRAQSVYGSSDFATSNDSFLVSKISILDIPNFDYTVAGADTNWDFSAFVPVSQEYVKYVDPNRTGFRSGYLLSCNALCYNDCYNNCMSTSQFPFLCPGYCTANCGSTCLNNWFTRFDLAKLSSDSINLGIATVEDIYNFYDKAPDALSQVAIGAKLSGFPIIVGYQNLDRIYSFPLEFGNRDTSFSNFSLDIDSIPGTGIPVDLKYRHGQQRYNHVEGWGTLKTPYGVFNNVIKIKSEVFNEDTVIFQGDTIALKDFLPTQIIPDRVVTYQWFSPDYGIPLLDVSAWVINGNLVYQDLNYLDSLRCFQPTALFGYLPFPAVISDGEDSVDVNFYSLAINGDNLYWSFDDDSSESNTAVGSNPSHQFTEGGAYNVQLVVCNTACPNFICDTFSIPVLVIDLRQPDFISDLPADSDFQVSFSPNPFSDELTARIESSTNEDLEMTLFDLTSREVSKLFNSQRMTNQTVKLNLSHVPEGMYLVQIRKGNFKFFYKLVKQR